MLNIFSIHSIMGQRVHQLSRQAVIDKKLKTCQCPEVLLQYFYKEREINRIKTVELSEGHFYDYVPTTIKHLSDANKELDRVELLIKNGTVCEGLLKN